MSEYKKVTRDAFMVIGTEIRTSNEPGCAEEDIPAHMMRFMGVREQIPNRVSDHMINLYYNYEEDAFAPYTQLFGHIVSSDKEVPEGMVCVKIPAQTYFKLPVEGEMPMAIVNAWQDVWAADLPRAYTFDFEEYDEEMNAELLIAIDNA